MNTSFALGLAERGLVPDRFLRWGIRRLLRDRLAEQSEVPVDARAAFRRELEQSPLALVPEKANEQHYEVPAAFYEKALGPRKKYSGCYFPPGVETLAQAEPHIDRIVGVGLDSGERGNPPSKFERVFARARQLGLRPVAHAGEEGPPAYISEALDLLAVERVDHGVRCVEDDAVVDRLVAEDMALTVCPLSNIKLRVFDTMADHNLAELLARGLRVTVNSDDPSYFGGYMTDNFMAVCESLDIGAADVIKMCENAANAAFVSDERRAELLSLIHQASAQ